MGMTNDKELIKDGIRTDGRKFDEIRDIKIEAHVLNKADGSAYLEWGNNKIMAAVYGPRETFPKHIQNPNKAIIRVRYNMATFSVDERIRPAPSRRDVELSKVISKALESVVLVQQFPKCSVNVNIEVLQADAGTRVAGITAAAVALADAGIPMRDLIVGCAAGKINDTIVLDLNKEEDNFGQADLPMAIVPRTKEIALLQMDGHLTSEEMDKSMDLIFDAVPKIYEIQKECLKNKYMNMSKKEGE